MEEILHRETIGWLATVAEGRPYAVPLNYAYIDGKIYFHCALEGRKLDAVRANPEVCLAVGRQEGEIRRHRGSGVCHPDNESVLCFGRARRRPRRSTRSTARSNRRPRTCPTRPPSAALSSRSR